MQHGRRTAVNEGVAMGFDRTKRRVASILLAFAGASLLGAQVGTVKVRQKISEADGGLGDVLNVNANFGEAVCSLGDLAADSGRASTRTTASRALCRPSATWMATGSSTWRSARIAT